MYKEVCVHACGMNAPVHGYVNNMYIVILGESTECHQCCEGVCEERFVLSQVCVCVWQPVALTSPGGNTCCFICLSFQGLKGMCPKVLTSSQSLLSSGHCLEKTWDQPRQRLCEVVYGVVWFGWWMGWRPWREHCMGCHSGP